MLSPFFLFFSFFLGACLGSFANVCIYRLPREESIISPGSHCVNCSTSVKFYDNIPIISFFLLHGKCRKCGNSISWIYPFVEFLTGFFFVAAYIQFGLTLDAVVYALLFTSLIIISMIDLEHKIIPDVISLPGIIIGLLCSIFILPLGIIDSLIGILASGGLFYIIAVLSRGGMGGGDIKLIAMLGAFIGWKNALMTIFLSALFGSVVGGFLMIVKKKNRKDMIPYGPFIALGAVISIFWGQEILIWYLSIGSGRSAVW